jgi:hypothetical protein
LRRFRKLTGGAYGTQHIEHDRRKPARRSQGTRHRRARRRRRDSTEAVDEALTERDADDIEAVEESVPEREAGDIESDDRPDEDVEAAESIGKRRNINGAVRRRPA